MQYVLPGILAAVRGRKKKDASKKDASMQASKPCRGLGFGDIGSPLGGGNGLRNETRKKRLKRGIADLEAAGIMEFFLFSLFFILFLVKGPLGMVFGVLDVE